MDSTCSLSSTQRIVFLGRMRSRFCRTPPCGGSQPIGQSGASAVAGTPSGGVQIAPWPGRRRPSARDGSSAPEEQKTKERGSPDCSSRDQVHLVRRARLPNRGVRERLYSIAGCHAAPEGKGSLCCGYSGDRRREDPAFDLNACAAGEVALGESRLR
jgi:hypothetical protein